MLYVPKVTKSFNANLNRRAYDLADKKRSDGASDSSFC